MPWFDGWHPYSPGRTQADYSNDLLCPQCFSSDPTFFLGANARICLKTKSSSFGGFTTATKKRPLRRCCVSGNQKKSVFGSKLVPLEANVPVQVVGTRGNQVNAVVVVQPRFQVCKVTLPPAKVRLPVLVTVPLLEEAYTFAVKTSTPFSV